jgi:hypothetical protein
LHVLISKCPRKRSIASCLSLSTTTELTILFTDETPSDITPTTDLFFKKTLKNCKTKQKKNYTFPFLVKSVFKAPVPVYLILITSALSAHA